MNFFLRIIFFVLKRKTSTPQAKSWIFLGFRRGWPSFSSFAAVLQNWKNSCHIGRQIDYRGAITSHNSGKTLANNWVYNTYYGNNWIEGCFFLFQHFAAAMAGNAGNWQQQAVMRGGGSGGHRGMSGGGAGFPPHQQQHQGGFHNAPPHMGGMPGGRGQQVGWEYHISWFYSVSLKDEVG